jgi:hypothetical protein
VDDDYFSPAHDAVEHENLAELVEQLRTGADPEEVWGGLTLLQHAIDAEVIAYEDGQPLNADMTTAILSAGADPRRPKGPLKSAQVMAVRRGHLLATELFDAWIRDHPEPPGDDGRD